MDPQSAAWGCDTLNLLVTATAAEEDARRGPTVTSSDLERRADEIHRMFAGLPADSFPLLTTYATEMVAGDGRERFRFAVDVVIDGVLARTART